MKYPNIISYVLVLMLGTLTLSSCATIGSPDGRKLIKVIDTYTQARKKTDPYFAPYYNVEEDLDKFGDYLSPEYFAREKAIFVEALKSLTSINEKNLNSSEKDDMQLSLEALNHHLQYFSFNQMGSRLRDYIDDSSPALTSFPFKTAKHYQSFVKRSEGFRPYVKRQIEVLREGAKANMPLNCTIAKNAIHSYEEALTKDVEKNPFYRPALSIPDDITEPAKKIIQSDFKRMIAENILPGFEEFDKFYKKEYLAKCRKTYGIGSLPGGKTLYEFKIRRNTDLKLDAETLHQTGLREVARIRQEMTDIKNKVGFKGSLDQFITSLTVDSKYYFKSGEDLFTAFKTFQTQVEPQLERYFILLPKIDFKLVEAENPEDPAASYRAPSENLEFGRC
jgi:uncharacterized protein (DUF885 family)